MFGGEVEPADPGMGEGPDRRDSGSRELFTIGSLGNGFERLLAGIKNQNERLVCALADLCRFHRRFSRRVSALPSEPMFSLVGNPCWRGSTL